MPSAAKLDWCVVRLGDDLNWWVTEVPESLHWDVDGLGIIDPRQMSYILELCDSLRDYGFDPEIVDEAFYVFNIDKELKDGRVRLVKSRESILEGEASHFALPDILDDDKGPYADFLDQITRFRVKLLNDLIEFDQSLTVDELEDEIRESQNQEYMEGRAVHPFVEVTSILEYVPVGYELEDEGERKDDDEDLDDIPDFEEDEKLEEDETMRWDEEEEDEDDFDDDEEGDGEKGDGEDDEEEEESSEDEGDEGKSPRRGRRR